MRYYFSRRPGRFVDELTGDSTESNSFDGTVREWYEMLCEFANKKAKEHFKTNQVIESYVSQDVKTIHECCKKYRLCGYINSDYLCGLYNKRRLVFLDESVSRNEIRLVNPKSHETIYVEIVDMDII